MAQKGFLVELEALLGSGSVITAANFEQQTRAARQDIAIDCAYDTYSSSKTRMTSSRVGIFSEAKEPLSLMRLRETSQSLFALPRALKALRAL